MPTTVEDVIKNALLEAGIYALGQALSADDSTFMLAKLNKIVDQWNAIKRHVYGKDFIQYNLVPHLAPHTIGPAASNPTFVVTQRPIQILSASIMDTSNPATKISKLEIHDAEWWAAQTIPSLSDSLPTDLYYEPLWPLGKLYFWPVPTTARPVLLETMSLLVQLTLATVFSMPPGYEEAMTLELALAGCPPYGRNPSPLLVSRHDKAIDAITLINSKPPCMGSDYPSGSGSDGAWNFRTGTGS